MAAAAPKLLQFKLVLLGESAVGKSSLVLRFVKSVLAYVVSALAQSFTRARRGQFLEYQESTIGGTLPAPYFA